MLTIFRQLLQTASPEELGALIQQVNPESPEKLGALIQRVNTEALGASIQRVVPDREYYETFKIIEDIEMYELKLKESIENTGSLLEHLKTQMQEKTTNNDTLKIEIVDEMGIIRYNIEKLKTDYQEKITEINKAKTEIMEVIDEINPPEKKELKAQLEKLFVIPRLAETEEVEKLFEKLFNEENNDDEEEGEELFNIKVEGLKREDAERKFVYDCSALLRNYNIIPTNN